MILLCIRILLVTLAVASIGAAIHAKKDINWQLANAQHLLKKGEVGHARAVVDSAINADFATYKAIAGVVYQRSGGRQNHKLASMLLEQAAAFSKRSKYDTNELVLFHTGNALLYEKMGQLEEAEKECNKALALAPDNPIVLNEVGWFYAENDIKLHEAVTLAQKAVELAPDNAMIVDTLGWAYYKSGEYDKAITTLRRAVELAPDQPELRYHLGAAYAKRGRDLEAGIELNKALLLEPSMKEPRELLLKNRRNS